MATGEILAGHSSPTEEPMQSADPVMSRRYILERTGRITTKTGLSLLASGGIIFGETKVRVRRLRKKQNKLLEARNTYATPMNEQAYTDPVNRNMDEITRVENIQDTSRAMIISGFFISTLPALIRERVRRWRNATIISPMLSVKAPSSPSESHLRDLKS
ncbi:MAG: hypothetical protein HYV40_05245 [Candidatus Levybacteria bacterium]|nr:hypothetical protein [Candidatus Levybacteria bacterium]